MLEEKPMDFIGGVISNELARLVANETLRVKFGQLELLEAQNKDLKEKIEELTRENNNAKKELNEAESELETVKKKQADQWMITLLCVISTLTSSTTSAQQKVDPKNDSVKPVWH